MSNSFINYCEIYVEERGRLRHADCVLSGLQLQFVHSYALILCLESGISSFIFCTRTQQFIVLRQRDIERINCEPACMRAKEKDANGRLVRVYNV